MAVDEAIILFKGRSSMKQFMLLKPIKRGYKAWCACDSLNGFIYNIDMYAVRSDRVVQGLMEPLYDQNYHGQLFQQHQSCKKLNDRSTYMIDTDCMYKV